ncbi:hypothetical protein R3P38DRAFT_2684516 [Favolaschia claudopus]|uniref:Uncharacterized protein n=1 Tax=Favolaschia claudopus TaxID=2862362 RepID=A0AAW0DLK3_9AGAR
MSSPTEIDPFLPIELERIIFQLCAQSLPVFTPQLMLVARRVKEWVEPFLYRVICIGLDSAAPGFPLFTPDTFTCMMTRKSPKFLRSAVRHFMVEDGSEYPVRELLNICTEIEDLWLPLQDGSYVPIIQVLPLRRLGIDFRQFLRLPLTCRALSGLTHLAFTDSLTETPGEYDAACAAFLALPKLTHLSFDGGIHSQFIRERIGQILESLPSLHVVVAFAYHIFDFTGNRRIATTDPRFVAFLRPDFSLDWHAGARGGADYWTDAENSVAKRRAGESDFFHFLCNSWLSWCSTMCTSVND